MKILFAPAADPADSKPGSGSSAWTPIDQAPLGIPIRVREGKAEVIAVRDEYVGWYNEARSGGIAIKPTEFQLL